MFGYDPDHDSGRYRSDPHYRLCLGNDGKAIVACLQDFDYYDYDKSRFIGPMVYDTEEEAEIALQQLLIDCAKVLGVPPHYPNTV